MLLTVVIFASPAGTNGNGSNSPVDVVVKVFFPVNKPNIP